MLILITFYSWVCCDVVRRKLTLVTVRTLGGWPAPGYNNHFKKRAKKRGRGFLFNSKFREFRLVHQMEQTISVWFDRNIRDQLWRWSTLTGLVISVGRTEMFLSIWQNCCPQYRNFCWKESSQGLYFVWSTNIQAAFNTILFYDYYNYYLVIWPLVATHANGI